MKQEFLNFINELIKLNPDKANELMTENVKAYLDMLREELKREYELWSNDKDLAESMGVSSRGTSSSLRKLVIDGFCEKIADNPSVYTLTEKGKNYNINIEEE